MCIFQRQQETTEITCLIGLVGYYDPENKIQKWVLGNLFIKKHDIVFNFDDFKIGFYEEYEEWVN